jgi:hypothetical protein
MVGLFEHRLYPCVERMSPPNTLAGRALSSTSGKVHETPEDHMVAIFSVKKQGLSICDIKLPDF